MTTQRTRPAGLALLAVFGLACSPTRELVDARTAYNRAEKGHANAVAPEKVYEAKKALARAERMHDRDPGSDEERDLAYVAQRKAETAIAFASMKDARKKREEARSTYAETLELQREQAVSSLRARERELDRMKGKLEGHTSEHEQQLREELATAMRSLEAVSSIKQEQGRTVLSISGSVVFKLGSADLMPIAKDRLDEVATVLRERANGSAIVIEGHTDSTGSDTLNEKLSQQRAEAVRQFLVARGVDPDKIEAVGRGEADPVASNASPEGRANNRRVEIIIDNGKVGMNSR